MGLPLMRARFQLHGDGRAKAEAILQTDSFPVLSCRFGGFCISGAVRIIAGGILAGLATLFFFATDCASQSKTEIENAAKLLREAKKLLETEKYDQAIAKLEEARRIHESADVYKGLGEIYYDQNKYDLALDNFQKYKSLSPNNYHPYNRLGWTLFRLIRIPEAITHFEKSNSIRQNSGSYEGLGQSYLHMGSHGLALASSLKSVELGPRHWWSFNVLGWSYYYMGRYGVAAAQFQKSMDLKKTRTNCNGMAQSCSRLGRYDDALNYLSMAMESAKLAERDRVRKDLASVHTAKGDYGKASAILEEIGQKNSLGVYVWDYNDGKGIRLADLFIGGPAYLAGLTQNDVVAEIGSQSLSNKSASDFYRIIKKQEFGSNIKVKVYRGGTLVEREVIVGLSPEVIRLRAKRKEDASSHYKAGNQSFEARKYTDAISRYKKAIELEDTFAPLFHNLGMAQAAFGQKEEAVLNLQRYLDMRPDASSAAEVSDLIKSLKK